MGMYTTRAVSIEEIKDIFDVLLNGASLEGNKRIESNYQVYLSLYTMVNTGLRISDVLELTPNRIKNSKLTIVEKKTGKIQNRDIAPIVYNKLMEYCIDNSISRDSKIFSIGERAIQKTLKKVVEHLQLENVSTHSFRKAYATIKYEESGSDIYVVQQLLNHQNIATTVRYLGNNTKKVNELSSSSVIE